MKTLDWYNQKNDKTFYEVSTESVVLKGEAMCTIVVSGTGGGTVTAPGYTLQDGSGAEGTVTITSSSKSITYVLVGTTYYVIAVVGTWT